MIQPQPIYYVSFKKRLIQLLVLFLCLNVHAVGWGTPRPLPAEKRIMEQIRSGQFDSLTVDATCPGKKLYHVYLVDNFTQDYTIIPEVKTSHGEAIKRLLQSGRDDIKITSLNTGLNRGLALILEKMLQGGCADAVISSVPGSNYTYGQVSSLLQHRVKLTPENILEFQPELQQLLRQVAFSGFLSVKWLEQLDMNSVKLKGDAQLFVMIETLGRLNIPVILPYGNPDTVYKGEIKNLNLLSLASTAKVYSALNLNGDRMAGFPYSPLSSGDEKAVYRIFECPHPTDPFKARIDINEDGFFEFDFIRTQWIPFDDIHGTTSFAPPLISSSSFEKILKNMDKTCRLPEDLVVTLNQFLQLKKQCPVLKQYETSKPYVWLNSSRHGQFFDFKAQCQQRGRIRGTSVIPPNKIKEFLPAR